jgi:hypothetical protein
VIWRRYVQREGGSSEPGVDAHIVTEPSLCGRQGPDREVNDQREVDP